MTPLEPHAMILRADGRRASRPDYIFHNELSLSNRAVRAAWNIAYRLLFRPTPVFMHGWRRFLLRLFGAKIEAGALPYPRCRIWAPWNLHMGVNSCIADDAECYSVGPISLGADSCISQQAYLCSATHDFRSPKFELKTSPVSVGAKAWIAARAFVGPGVTIGEGAVVGATASVFRDVAPWTVVGGNPAKQIGVRPERTDHGL